MFGGSGKSGIFVAAMTVKGFFQEAFHLYYDGFRSMTLGRTLWLIIGVKLFIMFAILKVFFFPDFLKQHATKGHEADYVATELTDRANPVPALPCNEGTVAQQEQINP